MHEELNKTDESERHEEEVASEPLKGEALFEANMEAFKQRMPGVYNKLKNHKPISKLILSDDGEMNVTFEGEPVFEGGAIAEADRQIKNLNLHAARLTILVAPDSMDNYAGPAFSEVLQRTEKSGLKFAQNPIRMDSYFLVVFGIGLGQHLDRLVEMTKCRTLALIEPNVDFLYHSCFTYDWGKLMERMQARGSIDFFLATKPDETADMLHRIFRRDNPMCFDGSMIFRHYDSAITVGIGKRLNESISTAVLGLGFFQDEINMLGQTYKNLSAGEARVIRQINTSPNVPAMIVGNGPSLEKLLPFIKENEDKIVIFSCGSALETLLENGIVPDFWVMMERGDLVLKLAKETAEKHDVSNIRFVGSTTIFPGTTDLFKDPILFFRPGLSSMPMFSNREDQVLLMPDPLAANAGMSVALHLGFREIYLAGVDVGSKVASSAHSPGGWYNRLDDPYSKLNVRVRGNFGGEVFTTPVLQWSKENLERLASVSRGRTFYNLSDGALMDGITPMHRRAAKLRKPARPKQEICDDIAGYCDIYDQNTFDEMWERGALVDKLYELCDGLKAALKDFSDFSFEFEVARLLETHLSSNAVVMLVRGTLIGFCSGYSYLSNRLTDPNEREVLEKIAKEEFAALIDRMLQRTTDVFLDIDAEKPWVEFKE